jgi:hypothetical protein
LILLYRAQAQQPYRHYNQQASARSAEDHAQKTIGPGQAGDANQFPDKKIDHGAHQQGGDKKNGAARDHAGRRCLDVVDQILRPSEPPNIQATAPAMIQVSKDNASLTKPRLRLIKAEMATIARIAQSTGVNGTCSLQTDKAAHFSRALAGGKQGLSGGAIKANYWT